MDPFSNIPLQRLENKITVSHKINLRVLRLDTIDLYAGGNKYFKLKYNLEEAKKQGFKKLLTFGGAWSNHLAAVAERSRQEAVTGGGEQPELIFVVRGEEPEIYSETLRFCLEKGARLHFVSREEYRRKTESAFIDELKNVFGDFYLLPEGGSNELAAKGCREIVDLIDVDFDIICCPIGSGGTFAGIVSALKEKQIAIGFPAFKQAEYIEEVITKLVTPPSKQATFSLQEAGPNRAQYSYDYHFGGFAKATPELLRFKNEFESEFGFELDYVYTAKMFYGIFDLIKKKRFPESTTIVAIHTGGLQGNMGFEKQ